MKMFFGDRHTGHAPQWYVADGTVRPCPEISARVDMIRTAVSALPRTVLVNVDEAGVDPWPAIRAVHAADYLEYLEQIHARFVAEFGGEGATQVIPDTFVPRAKGRATRPTKPAAQVGYYCFDMAAPMVAGTFRAAVGAATCAVAAAEAMIAGETCAYALCRPPGHHAGRDYCGGFCYLNNAAIAAQRLLMAGDRIKRVALLDIDYHHGNGTQDIFYERADVLFVSLHADPHTQYPYFYGHADETGQGAGAGFNVNLPLPRGTDERTWLATLSTACQRIAAHQPDAVVVSMGVDASIADAVGDFKMTHAGFAKVGAILAQLKRPTVFVQEGGYTLADIGPSAAAILHAFESTETGA